MSTYFTDDSYHNYLDFMDEEVSRRGFYKYLEMFEVDLSKFFETGNTCDKNLKQKFNILLRKIKQKYCVPIYESVNFIEQDFAEVGVILKMLDDRNWTIVKYELSKKYGKVIKNNNMLKFFVK